MNSLATTIAPYLPFLRRFARALTGSQQRGDAYVVATLEALVADPGLFDRQLAPKTATYRAFLKVWGALPANHDTSPAEPGTPADKRIESLTSRSRQVFLLSTLEEFRPVEVAAIMDADEASVMSMLDAAGKEIAAQMLARVLIIEDEPLIALDIEGIVTEIGHTVVGTARTHEEATRLAADHQPGLVLADIQLADGSSGIEAVNEILGLLNVPVIFITAYPERLLTGERAEPTFLITKPFRPEMVKAVISQALFFDMKARSGAKSAA